MADIEFGDLSLQAFAQGEVDHPKRPSHVHTRSTESIEECMFLCLAPVCDTHAVMQMARPRTSSRTSIDLLR